MADGARKIRGVAAAGAFVVSAYLAARRFGRRAGRRFDALVQNSSDVIAVVRADGGIEYVSPSIEKITGLGPEERLGQNAFDLIHPEDVEGVRADFADLLQRPGETTTGEFRILRADGDAGRVEAVAANRIDEPGIGGVVINYRDVTERRRAEEARFRLAAIVESSEDAITSGDLRGTIKSWNPGAERLYGRPAREAVGRTIREIMGPLDPGAIVGNISRVERGETVGPFDAVHHDSAGRALSVSVTLSPIRTPGGAVTGVAAVTRDVAEREETERALRASEERFRTAFEDAPLGVALAGLDGRFLRANRALCEMLGYREEGRGRALARIQSEADVPNALVADVRTAAGVERQDFAVDPRPVPVEDLLGDAAAFARSLPGDHELVVRDEAAGAVRADRCRTGQVLRNLLSNAAKYSSDGRPIGLHALPGDGDGRVRFEISDRGGRHLPGRRDQDLRGVRPRAGRPKPEGPRAGALPQPAHPPGPRRGDAAPPEPGGRVRLRLRAREDEVTR